MTRLLVVLIALAWASPAAAQSERAMHVAIGAYMVSSGADLAVTTYGLGAGQVREANPLLRWAERKPIGMAVTKMSIGAGLSVLLLKEHKKSKKAAFWTAVGLTALNGYITYRNAKLLPPLAER